MANIVQDTIHFNLTAETTVINDTVKVMASIEAVIQPGQDDPALRSEIRSTLSKLISGADWQFSNFVRSTDRTGLERVSLTATTRVSETENSNLDGRAVSVSRPGLTIVRVTVDQSIPHVKIEAAEHTLRMTLLTRANDELAAVNTIMGKDKQTSAVYRVSGIEFEREGSSDYSHMRTKSYAATAIMESAASDDSVLGHAEKIKLNARLTLSRFSR